MVVSSLHTINLSVICRRTAFRLWIIGFSTLDVSKKCSRECSRENLPVRHARVHTSE